MRSKGRGGTNVSARGAFAPNAQKMRISAKNLMIKKGIQFKLPHGASDSLALALASIVIQERDTERIKGGLKRGEVVRRKRRGRSPRFVLCWIGDDGWFCCPRLRVDERM